MLTIDGSQGEGGGQILRTSLTLSLCTGQPFCLANIRAQRDTPGLRPQHLQAVTAAAQLAEAEVSGAAVGSRELIFQPRRFGAAIAPGAYRFDIGTAGSTSLVLQTVLLPLLLARGASTVTLVGGTYNTKAPPFDFCDRVFAPLLRRIGVGLTLRMHRPGFYPAGGGQIVAEIEPLADGTASLGRLDLLSRGAILRQTATTVLARLPANIGEREHAILLQRMGWPKSAYVVRSIARSQSPGNVVLLEVESEHVTELFSSVGERGLPAEEVAERAAAEALQYLACDAPVGEHLADQLLLPLSLGAGGRYRTVPPSLHTRTQVEIIGRFLPQVGITLRAESAQVTHIEVDPGARS